MTQSPELLISAYLDGEVVEQSSVLQALETEDGQRALVDFTRIRLVATNDASPDAEFYNSMRNVIPTLPSRGRSLAWPLAAAVAASLVAGFLSGAAIHREQAELVIPPKATRVIALVPGVDWHPPEPQSATGVTP